MFNFLYNLIIEPIVIVYELVYYITRPLIYETYFFQDSDFISIIIVSVVFNILTYPLYKKADELQNEARLKKDKMSKWVDHIKKNFKGDERYFILSTYYKENNYSPFDQIKESLSLLIQIPFFAAAYIFFTSVNFGNFKALQIIPLGMEDSLLQLENGISINVLPILMSIINLISANIYTKGFKIKDKLISFILPIIFLIILYRSPSALVIYWTFNNIISLIKNIILKDKHTKDLNEDNKLVNDNVNTEIENKKNNINVLWVTTSIFLFLAIVIPTQVIKSSPEEFDSIYYSLYSFILYTVNVFLGFAIWTLVFYHFTNDKKKFVYVLTIINIFMIINHMFYINDNGFISTMLTFAMPNEFPIIDIILNIVYLFIIIAVFKLISKKFDIVSILIRAMCISFALWSIINLYEINKGMSAQYEFIEKVDDKDLINEINEIDDGEVFLKGKMSYIKYMEGKEYNSKIEDGSKSIFNISKNGKNVIFICIDKFLAKNYEYAVAVLPELKEKFDGFKVWENTISFGSHTIIGTPAMYGGYEYQPYESNKIDKELVEKHNEAITLMPKMLSDEGYDVTTVDMPYENYYDIRRESVWKDLPKVNNIHLEWFIRSKIIDDNVINTENVMKNHFVCYSILKAAPLIIKIPIYNTGSYLHNTGSYLHNAKNNPYKISFLQSFTILDKMNELCKIVDDDSDNALIMHNMTVHEEEKLNYPNFYPDGEIADLSYMEGIKGNDGQEFKGNQIGLSSTIATLKELGEFFDYLKANNVYDNTRIIIVADHGGTSSVSDRTDWELSFKLQEDSSINALYYNPILMYKDFDSKRYEESDEFMTNADAPYLALNGISKDMKNPWTGNEISMDYKKKNNEFNLIGSTTWLTQYFIGRKKFQPFNDEWAIFKGKDVLNLDNWKLDNETEKNSCIRGANHNLIYRQKTEEETCGTNYLMNMYECSICGKCFKDAGAVERIENSEQYMYDVPHKFINYISDNNDSPSNHGTKTAECDYGCGTKDTIYDDSVNMHHHFVEVLKKATFNEDGREASECDKCHLIEPGKEVFIIPSLKEIKAENENVEMTGNKTNAIIVGIDRNGNIINDDNMEVKFFSNEKIGTAYAMVSLKNKYENKNEYEEDEPIKVDYKIVPERVEIKSIEHKRGNLIIAISDSKVRINDVEIVVDDNEDKIFKFKKKDKNEYKVNLTEFSNEAKKIKVRVVRYDNTTGEALYSPWVEGEVK